MSIIALFIVFLVSVSANPVPEIKPVEGMSVPRLDIIGIDSQKVDLARLSGRYAVVHFWSARDAQSRIKAIELDRLAAASEGQLSLVSVNIDNNERLFREIVRADGLDEATQYFAGSAKTTQIVRGFGLSQGLQTMLIAPDGTILALNPSGKTIAQVIEL